MFTQVVSLFDWRMCHVDAYVGSGSGSGGGPGPRSYCRHGQGKRRGDRRRNGVKVAGGKLTIEDKDKKEHSCEVAKDAKITCDGKECKLADLKKGVKVKVTVVKKMATKIEATTK